MSIREGSTTPGRTRTTLLGYLALTKPRVIELLLVTTIPAMLLAHRGTVDPLLIATPCSAACWRPQAPTR